MRLSHLVHLGARMLSPLVVVLLVGSIPHLLSTRTVEVRRTSYQVMLAAAINTSSTAVGLADSDLIGLSGDEVEETLDRMEDLGVKQVRIFVPWAYTELIKDVYFWNDVDTVVEAADRHGIAVLAAVTSTPPWASDYVAPNSAPRDVADYAEFVGDLAKRYGNQISAYEVWNEPNGVVGWYPGPDPVAYTELLTAAYKAIKDANPDATVVGGVLGVGQSALGLTINPVDFVEQMYAAGAKGSFDALSLHPYQFSRKFSEGDQLGYPLRQYLNIRELMEANGDGDKLVWTTEYGLPTSQVSEAEQRDFIKDFLRIWSKLDGTGPTFIYTTRDRETGSTEKEDTFGIFRTDWSMKPAAKFIEDWIKDHDDSDPFLVALIKGTFQAIGDVVNFVVKSAAAVTKSIVNGVVGAIRFVVNTTVKAISWAVKTTVNVITGVTTAMVNAVDALASGIGSLFHPNAARLVSDMPVPATQSADPPEALDRSTARLAAVLSRAQVDDPKPAPADPVAVTDASQPAAAAVLEAAQPAVEDESAAVPEAAQPAALETVEPVTEPGAQPEVTTPAQPAEQAEPAADTTPTTESATPESNSADEKAAAAVGDDTTSEPAARPRKPRHDGAGPKTVGAPASGSAADSGAVATDADTD